MSTTQAKTSAAEVDQPDGVIHTEDLTKIYQGTDFAAVDKLNLDIRAGEIFGLLGPNGAGKTTTAGMLTTRVVPTSGRAFIAGVDVAAHPALAKQLSGIVSQQNTLDRQLTVWENLYFHGRLFGMGAKASRQAADELLEQFQLSRWARASVYALSGGMAQRLMVARAIFHRPSVLFLDEPTAGLDPQSRLALWDLLGELHGEGQTIMLTTHYMEEADRLCQRVAIMDHGRPLLGLLLGTSFEPRNIGLMFGFIILPITFLGGTYYSWTKLAPVAVDGWHWLQTIVLINPLIYVNEGMRAAFTNAPHMHLYVVYPVVAGFGALFLAIGLRNFRRRVLS